MAHIDHDSVKAAKVGRLSDDIRVLGMVHVDTDRDAGLVRRFGSGMQEQPVSILDCERK